MADKRRGKQKRTQDEPEKPTKEEYAVAKFLRFNVPVKEGKLMGMSVQYFIASKGVDALMDSKWGSKAKSDPLFINRFSCVDYCDKLLQKGIFHRALKLERTKREKEKKKKKPKEEDEKEEEKKGKKDKKSKKTLEKEKIDDKENEEESSKEGKEDKYKKEEEKEKKEEKKDEEKKRRKERKAKLEMHNHQVFKDGDEVYVWIYDPVPLRTFLIGLLLVLGAIAICLFPLWPPEVRLGIYYLSLAAAGFVGFILVLCIIRLILFCLVWGVTFGRHHFWFLPNLTEDVGFFDSFKPLYYHEYMDKKSSEKESKSEKSDEKSEEKDVNGEKNGEDSAKKEGSVKEERESGKEDSGKEGGSKEGSGKEESGSEGENDNGFEVVDAEEIDDDDDDDEEGSEPDTEDQEPKKTK